MPKLSILIPTYGRSEWLKQCLDSILGGLATDTDCEIIVSNDASPDNTEAVVSAYGDPRIRQIRQPQNLGSTRNFDFILRQSRGKYTCLLNDDDRVLPGCFEKKLALLDALPSLHFVHSLYQHIDAGGRVLRLAKMPLHTNHSYLGRCEYPDALVLSWLQHQTVVFRTDILEQTGGFVRPELALECSHDWDLMIRIARGRQAAFLHEPTVQVRLHSSSMTTAVGESGQFLRDRLRVWKHWLIDTVEPPVLSTIAWRLMHAVLIDDVESAFGKGSDQCRVYAAQLDDLLSRYADRMNLDLDRFLADARS